MSQRGIFISFEGVDGCGKSTQIKELRRRLRSLGDKIVLTREPGGTLLGEDIRKILQRTSDTPKIGERAELLLFTASRAQLVDEMLAPALSEGRHVIADRFLDSTTIYQGVARGLDPGTVTQINRFAVGSCMPDVTFLMDIAPTDSGHGWMPAQGSLWIVSRNCQTLSSTAFAKAISSWPRRNLRDLSLLMRCKRSA